MSFRHLQATAGAALAAVLVLVAAAAVQAAPKPKPGAAAASAAKKPFKDWSEVTKDARKLEGFFTVYLKDETLHLAIRPDQLDRDFLGIFSFARGIGTNFLLGGLPLNDRMLKFQRSGDRILLYEDNVRFTAPAGTPMAAAHKLSQGNSVLASFKIESEEPESKAVLIDFSPLLVSDFTDLAEGMKHAFGNKPVRFDKDRSALGKVKNFPENLEVEALLTYTPNNRDGLNLESVPDDRYIPITVHYSFSKLPDHPMEPRLADDRVGYFMSVVKDFGRDRSEDYFVRYIKRWRLEKKDPSAAVSDPVKPIVYYIDRTVPEEYRPYIKRGIENWQKAFEAAGFSNAIVARDAPADSNWDAEDVRYSTVRWIVSDKPSFGAIGPSRMDPRTGEILDADVLIEGSFVQVFRNAYRRYAGPEALADEVTPELKQWPSFLPADLRCDVEQGMADNGALLRATLLMDGSLAPGSPVPEKFIGEALVWVTMHEVGHTLGLRHNFRASTATPYAELQDTTWTRQHGLTTSVMDYLPINVSPDRAKQGEYFGSVVGDYDVWAIRYGYVPSGRSDVDSDYAVVQKIAEQSMAPGHEYSTDEDTYPANALDPRTNIWDLTDDPMAFARDFSGYVSSLWKSGKLENRVLGPDGDYPVLRRAMDTLLGQYARALGLVVKYVGGQYEVRNHRGQPGEIAPLTPVPAAKQREALAFLAQRAFAPNAFTLPPEVLNRLAPNRWSHWGITSPFSPAARVDYALNERALAIQSALLGRLLDPALLARMSEAESHTANPFRMSDYFDTMTRMLWGEVGPVVGPGMTALDGPNTRRDVQRKYVDDLATLVVDPPRGTPDDARALARLQLVRIDGQARRALASEARLGDYTRAHLLETRARIKRALEAGRETDVASHGGGGPGRSAVEQP